jgi:hypothetical protein
VIGQLIAGDAQYHAIAGDECLGVDPAGLRTTQGAIGPRHRLGDNNLDLIGSHAGIIGGLPNQSLQERLRHGSIPSHNQAMHDSGVLSMKADGGVSIVQDRSSLGGSQAGSSAQAGSAVGLAC